MVSSTGLAYVEAGAEQRERAICLRGFLLVEPNYQLLGAHERHAECLGGRRAELASSRIVACNDNLHPNTCRVHQMGNVAFVSAPARLIAQFSDQRRVVLIEHVSWNLDYRVRLSNCLEMCSLGIVGLSIDLVA
ncbi:MAG: hypothetical protein BGO26_01040 [Actinobacteria bacterium 69-20]|nr:MAG: hypothetical protein BGO26_01040 [Actinobacteria bacterium 69-20]